MMDVKPSSTTVILDEFSLLAAEGSVRKLLQAIFVLMLGHYSIFFIEIFLENFLVISISL